MSIAKGLAAIRQSSEGADSGTKINWLKMPDGATWRIRFLDDLDESPAIEAGAGTAVMIKEHVAGANFRVKAQCTKEDEGHCFACERAIKHPKTNWAQKWRVYINVLVNNGVDEPFVAVWSMSAKRSAVWDFLVDVFVEDGSIANREFRVKRNGEGTDTTYLLRDLGEDKDQFDYSEYERFDLEAIVRKVPYAEQEAYYLGSDEEATEDAVEESVESTEW